MNFKLDMVFIGSLLFFNVCGFAEEQNTLEVHCKSIVKSKPAIANVTNGKFNYSPGKIEVEYLCSDSNDSESKVDIEEQIDAIKKAPSKAIHQVEIQ